MRAILEVFFKKWHLFLLLIPSAVIAYLIALIPGFWIANAFQLNDSDYLAVLIFKIIFSLITPVPMILYWKNVLDKSEKEIITPLVWWILYVLIIGLSWIFINSI